MQKINRLCLVHIVVTGKHIIQATKTSEMDVNRKVLIFSLYESNLCESRSCLCSPIFRNAQEVKIFFLIRKIFKQRETLQYYSYQDQQ